jgi:hypothetical protein
LKGHVGTFSNAPNVITNESDLEAVHQVNADVKVVQDIQWCKTEGSSFIGCSWRRTGPKTMIVTQNLPATPQILWAHEFGHTTGLQHRNGANALMSPCKLDGSHVEINQNECKCFLAGPGGCSIPDNNLACTTDSN